MRWELRWEYCKARHEGMRERVNDTKHSGAGALFPGKMRTCVTVRPLPFMGSPVLPSSERSFVWFDLNGAPALSKKSPARACLARQVMS